jgi:hypothetical protein
MGFHVKAQLNRAGLLLSAGSVYVAFGSRYEDSGVDYHGYVVRFDASTLAYVSAYRTTPTTLTGGGIWQAGTGLAADSSGNIYFATGNGDYNFDTFCKSGASSSPYTVIPDTCNDAVLSQAGMPGTQPLQDEDSIVKLSSSLAKVGSYAPWESIM